MGQGYKYALAAVVGAGIVFLLMRGCGNRGGSQAADLRDTLAMIADSVKRVYEPRIASYERRAQEWKAIADAAQVRLQVTEGRIRRAGAAYEDLKTAYWVAKRTGDAAGIQKACDSCFALVDAARADITMHRDEVNRMTESRDSLEAQKDRVIATLRDEVNMLKRPLPVITEVLKNAERRTEFYIGGRLLYPTGVTGSVGLLTRKGVFLEADYGTQNGQPVYAIGAKWRISFKKY